MIVAQTGLIWLLGEGTMRCGAGAGQASLWEAGEQRETRFLWGEGSRAEMGGG